MNATTLEIRSDLKIQPDHLAKESHHSETDQTNEALSLYLAQQYSITKRIQEGFAQAQRSEFVADEEMDAFFACYTEPKA